MPRIKLYYYESQRRKANTEAVRRHRENKKREALGLPTVRKPKGFPIAWVRMMNKALDYAKSQSLDTTQPQPGLTNGDQPIPSGSWFYNGGLLAEPEYALSSSLAIPVSIGQPILPPLNTLQVLNNNYIISESTCRSIVEVDPKISESYGKDSHQL